MLFRTRVAAVRYDVSRPRSDVSFASLASVSKSMGLFLLALGAVAVTGVFALTAFVVDLASWLITQGEPMWLVAAVPFMLGFAIVIAAAWLGAQLWRRYGLVPDIPVSPLSPRNGCERA